MFLFLCLQIPETNRRVYPKITLRWCFDKPLFSRDLPVRRTSVTHMLKNATRAHLNDESIKPNLDECLVSFKAILESCLYAPVGDTGDNPPSLLCLDLLRLMLCTWSFTRCGPVRRLLSEGSASDVSSPLLPIRADLSGSAAITAPARRHRGFSGKFGTQKRRAVQLTGGSLGVSTTKAKRRPSTAELSPAPDGRASLLHTLVAEARRCRGMKADTPVGQAQTLSLWGTYKKKEKKKKNNSSRTDKSICELYSSENVYFIDHERPNRVLKRVKTLQKNFSCIINRGVQISVIVRIYI